MGKKICSSSGPADRVSPKSIKTNTFLELFISWGVKSGTRSEGNDLKLLRTSFAWRFLLPHLPVIYRSYLDIIFFFRRKLFDDPFAVLTSFHFKNLFLIGLSLENYPTSSCVFAAFKENCFFFLGITKIPTIRQ